MGVLHLWDILSPAGENEVKLSELSGKVIAVDLSAWILELRKCEGTSNLHNLYLRNLFYRTLEFMREGVQLIFVLDGLAPAIKHEKLNKQRENTQSGLNSSHRPYLEKYSAECVKLIECLGIPWICSPGEGEEMCAHLNQNGIADGCITKDSDFFCYGGKTLYRLRKESKPYKVDIFKMDKIEADPGFHRSDLVAMALLLGCDYNQGGVKNVGKEKAVTLLKSWKEKGVDSLQRILSWYENRELDMVEEKAKNRSHKESHCKKCSHEGNTKKHQKVGCSVCKTEADCIESCDISCGCDWHREDHLIQGHKLEVTIRQRSRETDNFIERSKKIVQEYMKPDLCKDKVKDQTKQGPIDVNALLGFLRSELHMTQVKVLEVVTPVIILSQMYQTDDDDFMYYTPVRIERNCKQYGIEGYLVSWDKTDRNVWPMASSMEVKVENNLFTKKFPQLVKQFEDKVSIKAPKGKRKQTSKPDADCPTPAKKMLNEHQENGDQIISKKKSLKRCQPMKGQRSILNLFPQSSLNKVPINQQPVNEQSVNPESEKQIVKSVQSVNQTPVKQPSVKKPSANQPSVIQTSVDKASVSQPIGRQPSTDKPSSKQTLVNESPIGHHPSVNKVSVNQQSVNKTVLKSQSKGNPSTSSQSSVNQTSVNQSTKNSQMSIKMFLKNTKT